MMASETYSLEGPQCPYCLRQYTADDPAYYSEKYTEEVCDNCNRKFSVEVYHSTSWTCEQIDDAEAVHP
jgi:hypothetical protein